jgi:hypothetical protein
MMRAVNMQKLMAVIFPLLIFPITGSAVNGPKLVCDEPVYQFGRVNQSAVVTNVFMIRNEGDTTFVAGMPRATCSCTKVLLSKRMIGPGETAELTAVFTAERRIGEQRKTIYLPSSDSEKPTITFYMQGFVEPPAESH